ncbi:glycerophosphodiester phosphodiesterase family protein [Lysinibacter cavernae]|uniref:glycerophosphodiester phosphodiesterase n=1 Tax=Lysinibacter cavernae TaxID=1640652 RepID=A0A7X5R1A4_9MICO|nr:glycerophosphodiester phosphodiesterase family protein [Lysinibacter cavernae]NIH53864.1 glycerophosphoryl diester phosphodiesterase [Lysinibacter cavernae]
MPLPAPHLPATRPLIIGHRGASGYRPEHTREAYELAIEQGADALEPDLVATRDGVLVIRHENEISTTTNVSEHPEFESRRTTKTIDGVEFDGWFTEDFTWAELSTLRARERLGDRRPQSAAYNDQFPILRFTDLLGLLDAAASRGKPIILVAEIKHASYFEAEGLSLDALFADELARCGWADPRKQADLLVVESFERRVLTQIRRRGIGGKLVYLVEDSGAPADEVAFLGQNALPYASSLTEDGLAGLARGTATHVPVQGVSVPKRLLIGDRGPVMLDRHVIDRVHDHGLELYTWTLRPENAFLHRGFRSAAGKNDYGDWEQEFELLMRSGVDGVFCDHPDLAVRVLGSNSRASVSPSP